MHRLKCLHKYYSFVFTFQGRFFCIIAIKFQTITSVLHTGALLVINVTNLQKNNRTLSLIIFWQESNNQILANKELDSESILLHNYCEGKCFCSLILLLKRIFQIQPRAKLIVTTELLLKCVYYAKLYLSLLGRAFQVMKNGIFFYCNSILRCELLKIVIYANQRTCDVTIWTQNDVK